MTADVTDLRTALLERARIAFVSSTDALLAELDQLVPDSGSQHGDKLRYGRDVIATEPDEGIFATVITYRPPQAFFTEFGTIPHEIKGNPTLAFYWPKIGRDVFFASVQHPGTTGTHWFERSFDAWPDLMARSWAA